MLAISPAAASAADPHHPGAVPAPKLRFLQAADAKEIEAIAERIIPSDDGPGAKEAGALYFIDGGLATFAKDQQPVFRDGLDDLAKRVQSTFPSAVRFSALTAPQQDQLHPTRRWRNRRYLLEQTADSSSRARSCLLAA